MEERFIHLTPLLVFTTSLIIAVGIVLGTSADTLIIGYVSDKSFELMVWAFILTAIGAVFAFFHLGHPIRSWHVFQGINHSWLSREAFLFGVFAICVGIQVWLLTSSRLDLISTALLYITTSVGIAAIWSVAMVYNLHAQIEWQKWTARIGPLIGAIFLGASVFLLLGGVDSQKWRALIFFAALAFDFTLNVFRLRDSKRFSRPINVLVYPRLRPLVAGLYILRLVLSAMIAALAIFDLMSLAMILVAAAIALGRFGLYAGSAQLTPKAEVASIKAQRMNAASN
ncbi:MAG: dimethyl sulfoxide reductase anchor subunit [Proteobacteria bacterium]|nr:dimethyl sulfoxide reductase anchor subunit [Pseudomonadota bacterium]